MTGVYFESASLEMLVRRRKASFQKKNFLKPYAHLPKGHVSPVDEEIIFTIPGVPGEKEYLVDFLQSLYEKLYPIFLKQKTGE